MNLSAKQLAHLYTASPFVREQLERHPQWLEHCDAPPDAAVLRDHLLRDCARAPEEAAQLRLLRQTRNRELTRIAVRDVAGLAPLDETLHALSDLAEACGEAALRCALATLGARHGQPRDEDGAAVVPVLLGMGKLGGRELNFSSDIDLIFCYSAGGHTDGAQPLSNGEFFAKCVQQFTRLLALRTEDGFVYRVDWMLRPFGSAGAPAASFDALEQYYQTHGREWERYALIKARGVAGDAAACAHLLKTLQPFVYRRYLDYNAIGNLRELKRLIEEEVRRKDLHDNLKLGDGGIREIEFIVQALQLIRGGQDAALRDTQLRRTLRSLQAHQRLDPEAAQALDEAYVFLRRAENALQMYGDEQVHALPTDPARRAALCAALQFADWDAFLHVLNPHRARVHAEFERLFKSPERAPQANSLHATLRGLWHGHLEAGAAAQVLESRGYPASGASAVVESLASLQRSRLVRLMREDAANKLLLLLDALLCEAASHQRPELTATRALQVVQAISGRATYLTLLRENDTARAQLLKLCAASPWLTDLLAASPALLDALLDAQALTRPPSREEMHAELARQCADLTLADTERSMDTLRRYQKDTTLRVAAAALLHGLPLVKVSDHLTWLAEIIVQKAMQMVWSEMTAAHGEPHRADGAAAAVTAIAYGKFGGLEMSYGSDLDLVFLHDCDALQGETPGGKPIANETWLTRYVQRVINWLSAQTHLGRAYEVDLELRPDGRRGMSITSLASFTQYQRESAWTWEHQALTRARWVAGDAGLGAAFSAVRAEVLTRPRDPSKLRQDLLDMRTRMREKLDKSTEDHWDVKQGAGGLIDAEFLTQYLVLRDAPRDSAIIEFSDNWRQLDALERAGSISSAQHDSLIAIYREYRACTHARALQNESSLLAQGEFSEQRKVIANLWAEIFQ